MAATVPRTREGSTASDIRKIQQQEETFQKMRDQIADLPPGFREAVARNAHISDAAYDGWLDNDGSALLYVLETKDILTRANLPVVCVDRSSYPHTRYR